MMKIKLPFKAALVAIFVVSQVDAQQSSPRRGRFDAQIKAALAEPYRGIYYLDVPPAGLFPIQKTGVSTEPVRQSAKAFLASLSK